LRCNLQAEHEKNEDDSFHNYCVVELPFSARAIACGETEARVAGEAPGRVGVFFW
jgi:hypothetical protein